MINQMENQMKYVRLNYVDAEPMKFGEFKEKFPKSGGANVERDPADDGYIVKYPDGYVSWCPKEQFENNAFSDDKNAPFRSIPDPDQLLMLFRIFHDERYSNCSCDEKATRLVHAYYNEYVGRPSGFLTFGMAIEAMKRGKKVARRGWNGKGQFVTVGNQFTYVDCNGKQNAEHQTSGTAALIFHGTIGVQVGWLASQSDMLSEDWVVVD